jgi:hypothetical protein
MDEAENGDLWIYLLLSRGSAENFTGKPFQLCTYGLAAVECGQCYYK